MHQRRITFARRQTFAAEPPLRAVVVALKQNCSQPPPDVNRLIISHFEVFPLRSSISATAARRRRPIDRSGFGH